MPIEVTLLERRPVPFTACPSCGAEPFRPFLRGQVQRTPFEAPVSFFRAWWRGISFATCAAICTDCKDIVGWEAT